MRILLTGHQGFIGSELFKRLKSSGHTVYGFDIKSGQDICTSPFEFEIDLVVHLAGKSGVRESLKNAAIYWQVNVEASKRIFETFKHTRIIYASSSSAYEPYLNPYAASKFMMELAARKHSNSLGLRLHTVYSETPRPGMFFDKLLSGELEYTTPHLRDFIHLEDVCDAFELLIDNNLTGVIDIGTGRNVSIQNIAPELPVRLNTPHERKCTKANIKELVKLGFRPKYTIEKFLTNKDIEHKI